MMHSDVSSGDSTDRYALVQTKTWLLLTFLAPQKRRKLASLPEVTNLDLKNSRFHPIRTFLSCRDCPNQDLCNFQESATVAKQLRIGFVGAGGIAHMHAKHLSKHTDVQIVAAADVNEAALKRFTD